MEVMKNFTIIQGGIFQTMNLIVDRDYLSEIGGKKWHNSHDWIRGKEIYCLFHFHTIILIHGS